MVDCVCGHPQNVHRDGGPCWTCWDDLRDLGPVTIPHACGQYRPDERINMTDAAQLRAQMIELQKELRDAEDAEFCRPGTVRTVLNDIAKAIGGLNDVESKSLQDLAAEIITKATRLYNDYQSSLWPKDVRC